jgi:Shikimate 5-dehydrogenase
MVTPPTALGLVRDLTVNHEIVISGLDVLILGAGGAVRGILDPLFDEQPARVVIANRTLSRAEQLSRIFSDRGDIKACGFDALKGSNFTLSSMGHQQACRE